MQLTRKQIRQSETASIEGVRAHEQPFYMGVSDLSFCKGRPFRLDGGGIVLCTSGSARLSIDLREYDISANQEAVLFTKPTLYLRSASDDFRARVVICSDTVIHMVCHKLGPDFFDRIVSEPIYTHTAESLLRTTTYLDLMQEAYADTRNDFRTIITSNLHRCLLLNISDRIRRDKGDTGPRPTKGRHDQIFDRFMEAVEKHALHHRSVSYYASKLCLSERYLSTICRSVDNRSPKQIIDDRVTGEIKILLVFSDMTLQQIADAMHFPDQSYLGRYFKAQTGYTPVTFRNSGM